MVESIRQPGASRVVARHTPVIMPLSMIDKLHVGEWEQMVDVNIKGVLYGIAAVLPHMLERGQGRIINVSSVAGHVIFPGASRYTVAQNSP